MGLSEDRTSLYRRTLRRILRPVARGMISHGMTFGEAEELLKQALVDAAAEDFPLESRKTTDSRIALLTGVHRKDVRRLRSDTVEEPRKRSFASLCALVVGRWQSDPAYLDEKGGPALLLRQGPALSFETLVREIGRDVPASTILDELLRLEIVRQTDNGSLGLTGGAYLAGPGDDATLEAYGKNLGAHLDAATENLTSDGQARFLERAGHYNRLSERSAAKLDEEARKLAMDALRTLNAEALRRQAADSADPENRSRFSFGAYVHFADPGPASPEDDE